MRELKRRTFVYYLPVYDKKQGIEIGHLGDLTEDGCLVLSDEKYPEGTKLELEIKLPDKPMFVNRTLTFKASVKWVKSERLRDLFHHGFRITNKERETDKIIENLIDYLGFSDGEKKIFLNSN